MDDPETMLREIEDIVTNATYGWRNENALAQIRERLIVLERMPAALTTREKLAEIRNWSEVLYSPRKHARYGSAEAMQVRVLGKVMAARSALRMRANAGQ